MSANKSKFDLEQQILQCWSITDDIEELYICLGNRQMPEDELQNYLLGLKTIYDVKFDRMFSTFEKLLKELPR